MNRNVLLLEPNYKNKFPPIGLMKLATYFRLRGDNVVFYKGDLKEFLINDIANDCVIININANYNRCMGATAIYQATKECWRMDAKRLKNIKYVLAEYRGLIVEVFEVHKWNPIKCHYTSGKNIGKECKRWGFEGSLAPDHIRDQYLNKSVAHLKKRGQANPIRYSI